jgi:hypothetical protein
MPSGSMCARGSHRAVLLSSLAGFDDDYKSSSLERSLQARC